MPLYSICLAQHSGVLVFMSAVLSLLRGELQRVVYRRFVRNCAIRSPPHTLPTTASLKPDYHSS